MNKLNYISVLFFFLTVLAGCQKHKVIIDNSFYDKTFKWKITIPKDYERLDQKEVNEIKSETKELLGKKDSSSIKMAHTIIAFNKNDSNYFAANYEDYSTNLYSVDLRMELKDLLIMKNMGQILPTAKLEDYSVGTENISGLKFRKSKIILSEKGKIILTTVVFSRLFNDKIFIVVIVYENEIYGKAMIDLFKQSTFKK